MAVGGTSQRQRLIDVFEGQSKHYSPPHLHPLPLLRLHNLHLPPPQYLHLPRLLSSPFSPDGRYIEGIIGIRLTILGVMNGIFASPNKLNSIMKEVRLNDLTPNLRNMDKEHHTQA